ncbi:hypothetical protein ABPG77_010473 [Micractinium sp. CCAP 211/92]
MDESTNHRDLLQLIEGTLYAGGEDVDCAAFLAALQHSKPAFLNLLRYKEPNAESRAAVQSGNPLTPAGHVPLDPEPDVREVLLLADELKLDEVLAVLCVQGALQETGEVSAAAGAGIYFEERRGLLTSLWLLLQAQVMLADSLPAELYRTICAFNADLLSQSLGGRTLLVQRLAELLRDNRLEAQPGSRLPVVVDSHGREVDRNGLVQREQTVLCECLVYACCIRQRLTAADISDLIDLLHRLGLKARAAAGDMAAQQQAYVVLFAVLLTLLPLENAEGAELEADERLLRDLAGSADVDSKIGGSGAGEDAHGSVLKLAWGVLLSQYGPEHVAGRAVQLVKDATGNGAFGFLRTGVLDSVPMQDDADHQRELYASIANQLVMNYLMSPAGTASTEALEQLSISQGQEEVAASATPASAPAAGAMMVLDAAQAAAPAAKPDSLATLLGLLASIYGMHPGLFLQENLKYDQFGQLMEGVAGSAVLASSPSSFLAYLEVLTALASGEKGARSMYMQLRGDDRFSQVNWRRMFQLLITVVRQYIPEDGTTATGTAAAAAPAGSIQQRMNDFVLPACDSKALCAYLGLFKRVMAEGRVEEVLMWLRQLEEDAGVAPVWEVLFQAMCCPVPQELKAALDEAIASLARRPDLAAALWERLVAAVVVAPASADNPAVPRYDLSYQLNEIEARAEDYSEAIAFVHLLNALWRGGGSGSTAPADDGRSVAHFTKFVRDDLLSTAFQRAYKEERQRWLLVSACLEHCELCLESLRSVAALATDAASTAAVKPPGLDVLLDLLGERNVLRAAMVTTLIEVDRLAFERHSAPFGAAKEAAVLAALRLLRRALEQDVELVVAMQQASHSASYETLDMVLRHDRKRIPMLLDFVRYPHNPAVQAEAVRIATHLSERIPNLVPLLLNSPPTGNVPAVHRLQDGFAACLQDSLFNLGASVSLEDDQAAAAAGDADVEAADEAADPRAELVLQLLLASLEQPAPNLSHLLCGFDFESGMGPVYLPDPRGQYNVLRVVLNALLAPALSARKPALFEHCLELLYELAASPDTGIATLDLLRGYYSMLSPLLDSVACAPLPEGPVPCASSLHQRAWLLQLHALELHRADVALSLHSESVEMLLRELFSPEAPNAATDGMGQGRSRMVDLLELVTSATPAEPQLGRDAHPEVRRMLQALELDALLASGTTVQQGGVRAVSTRGVALFDVIALKDELLKRYNEWVARHGGASEALKEACRLALQYAQQYNAYVGQLAGQGALLAAWQAVLLVAFTRRFEQLAAAAGGGSPTELVLQMAEECLRVLAGLVMGEGIALAPALCEAVQALLARLQEQVAAACTEDPLGGMPLPARCHDLLQMLLEAAWQGRKLDAVRLPMYSALASYLTMCRGPALLRAPPAVVEALLAGMPSGSSAAAQLDALQSQLEEGNAALLHQAAPVLELLAADALSAEPAQAARALTALSTVLAADPTGGSAEQLYRTSLPGRILSDLQETPHKALTQPPPHGQALLLVAEAQLTLLLRLALAGPPAARSASAQRLAGLHALAKLSQCRAIDLQPEEPGFGQFTGAASLRQRLHQLLTPLLRLVLAIVTALPNSSAVREQARAFVDAHGRTLTRVLHDAASPGIRGWEPGDAELEEATLAVQLLAELAPVRDLLQAGPQLQEAAYRLSTRFLCLSSKSPSPAVARVHAARESGRLTHRQERTHLRVLAMRCALSHYLLQLSADPRSPVLFRCTPSAGGRGGLEAVAGLVPTLFLVKDAMLQAVLEDMPELLADEPLLLDALREGDSAGGADLAVAAAAAVAASPGGGPGGAVAGRAQLARAAASAGGQLSKLLYLTEHLLALLYTHLRLCLPAPALGAASPDKGLLAVAANGGGVEGGPGLQALGSERDLDQLRRLMEPIIMQLERATAGASLAGRDVASLALLVRRTKEYLSMLSAL